MVVLCSVILRSQERMLLMNPKVDINKLYSCFCSVADLFIFHSLQTVQFIILVIKILSVQGALELAKILFPANAIT